MTSVKKQFIIGIKLSLVHDEFILVQIIKLELYISAKSYFFTNKIKLPPEFVCTGEAEDYG